MWRVGAAMVQECQQVGSEGEGGAGWLEEPALRTERVEKAKDRVGNFVSSSW